MIIKLTQDTFNYLEKELLVQNEDIYSKLKIRKEAKYVYIEIDDDSADEVRDWAIDSQMIKGFDDNDNLTSEGKILENLINAFYIK
jgi:hypothetical protein